MPEHMRNGQAVALHISNRLNEPRVQIPIDGPPRQRCVTDPDGQKDHRIVVLGGYKLVTQSRPYTAAIATGSEQGVVCCIELALIKIKHSCTRMSRVFPEIRRV
jgi:hypothetical protein